MKKNKQIPFGYLPEDEEEVLRDYIDYIENDNQKSNEMDKKNTITITIAGKTKVGKSTITKIINDALTQHGIETELSDEVLFDYNGSEDRFNETLNVFFDKRIKSIKNKSKVVLKNIQLGLDFSNN